MRDLTAVLSIIIVSGLFGGMCSFVSFSIYEADGKFREKITARPIAWPATLLLNGILGICGALAIQILVIGMRFYESASKGNVSDYIFLIAICVIAGFGARSFLFRLTSMFEQKIGQLDEKADEALTTARQASEHVDAGMDRLALMSQLRSQVSDRADARELAYAAERAKKQFATNRKDGEFALIAGRALRRLNKLDEAIAILTDYIDAHGRAEKPDYTISHAYYNRACYNCLRIRQIDNASFLVQALSDLEIALELAPQPHELKAYARLDDDFISLRNDARFIDMVGRQPSALPRAAAE